MSERKTLRARHPLIARTPAEAEQPTVVHPKTARTFYLEQPTIAALDAWVRDEWQRSGKKPSSSDFVNQAILQALKQAE
jgi:hypothetical protein